MLVAIFTYFLLGGASPMMLDYIDESRDNAKAVIPHDDRRASALEQLKAMEKLTKGLDKERKKKGKALAKAWKNYSGDYEQIGVLWQAHFDELRRLRFFHEFSHGEMLDRREELKKSITREEWSQVFPAQ